VIYKTSESMANLIPLTPAPDQVALAKLLLFRLRERALDERENPPDQLNPNRRATIAAKLEDAIQFLEQIPAKDPWEKEKKP